jgi:PilZ domain
MGAAGRCRVPDPCGIPLALHRAGVVRSADTKRHAATAQAAALFEEHTMAAYPAPEAFGGERNGFALADRRRVPRIELVDRLHGHVVSLGVPVVAREISLGGVSLEVPLAFPPAAVHEFRLVLGDGSSVVLRGRVVHCRPVATADGAPRFIIGVEFLDASADGVITHDLIQTGT